MANSTKLMRYDAARAALEKAHRIDEAKDIRDQATALEAYAIQKNDLEMQIWISEIKLRASKRIGEISKKLPIGRGVQLDSGVQLKSDALKQAGIEVREGNKCEHIADIPPEEFEEYIKKQKDKKKPPSFTELLRGVQNERKKRAREAEIAKQKKDIKSGKIVSAKGPFDVIVFDPPWPYGTPYNPSGFRGGTPYPEMSLEEIENVPMARKTTPDCVLWLWTTHKFMRHSFPLLDAWGFEEKVILTWVKDKMGTGRWLRSQSEFCILAVRGKPKIHLSNQTTILNGKLREHSRKPDEFYEMVESLCLGIKRYDWFAREKRKGWAIGGNDTGKFKK